MFGYDRPSQIGGYRPAPLSSPETYDAMFANPNFDFQKLNELIAKSDPFKRSPVVGGAFAGANQAGYETFADLSRSQTFANQLKERYVKVKDKQAVSQRLDALKKLGMSGIDAELNVNNPKFFDYFNRNDVAKREYTFMPSIATKSPGGLTLSEQQNDDEYFKKVDRNIEANRRSTNAQAQDSLNRRQQQLDQDLEYQSALRDEGLRRDYLDPNQVGGRRGRGMSAEDRRAQEEYLGTVEEARVQELLADGAGLPAGSRPEDVIGSAISKRYSRTAPGYAGLPQLEKETQYEAARYGDDVKFDSRSRQYVPTLTGKPDDAGRMAAAESLNAKLSQAQRAQEDYFGVMENAQDAGLVLKNGRFYDTRTGRSYQRPPDVTEDDYLASQPINPPMGTPSAFSQLRPDQRAGVIKRAGQLMGDTEELYSPLVEMYSGDIAAGKNPNSFRPISAQTALDTRRVQEIATAIERGLVPLDLDRYGGDVMAAAWDIFRKTGHRGGVR